MDILIIERIFEFIRDVFTTTDDEIIYPIDEIIYSNDDYEIID